MSQKTHASPALYRADIDGLRTVAVFAVVIFHAFPQAFAKGFLGVDIFFVISGFLITGIILKSLNSPKGFSFLEFYRRRIRRIFPALIIVMASCYAFGWFALLPVEFAQLGKHIFAGSTFISNFVLWRESGYFDQESTLKPLLHLWSLGVEEQYYILWPAVLWLAWRVRFQYWLITGIFFFISLIIYFYLSRNHASAAFYLPQARMWELLAGSMLASVEHYAPHKLKFSCKSANILSSAGAALVMASFIPFMGERWPLVLPGFLCVMGAVMIVAAGQGAWMNKKLLAHPVAVFIGKISFPLYLWHWPLLSYGHIVTAAPLTFTLAMGLVGCSFVLAWLVHVLVEVPLRDGKQSGTRIIILCLGMVALAETGLTTYLKDGFTQRKAAQQPPQVLEQISGAAFNRYYERYNACELPSNWRLPLTYCRQSKAGLPNKIIWGDSHANHLFAGIADSKTKDNWWVLAQSSCPPLLGVRGYKKGEAENCLERNQAILNFILRTPSIDTVVLSAEGAYYISDTGFAASQEPGGRNDAKYWRLEIQNGPQNLSKAQIFEKGLQASVNALVGAGKKVVLFKDVPEIPFTPDACIARPLDLNVRRCSLPREVVRQRQKEYSAIIARIAATHATIRIFESTDVLCDAEKCVVGGDDFSHYRDGDHLSISGSQLMARHFLPWLYAAPAPLHIPR